jgi:hypothetical protein
VKNRLTQGGHQMEFAHGLGQGCICDYEEKVVDGIKIAKLYF